VKELVIALLDRLRNLSTEFEPLSKHLSLCKKLFQEIGGLRQFYKICFCFVN